MGVVLLSVGVTVSIDLDAKFRGRAIEVENIDAERVLAAKPKTEGFLAKQAPQVGLGSCHRATQGPGAADCLGEGAHPSLPQFVAGAPTTASRRFPSPAKAGEESKKP